MDLLLPLLLLLAAVAYRARADVMVTGSVFCDQCKDGEMSIFDYPLSGAKVAIACPGSDGQMTVVKEDNTNMLGNYAFNFEGTPDMSHCAAVVMAGSGKGQGQGCGAASGPARGLNLLLSMFGMGMYTADVLLSQPARPMPFCPGSSSGSRLPLPPRASPSPPAITFPPMPLLQASACSYRTYMLPQFKCYWKVVGPDTKVAVAFGLPAARKYGMEMTLMEGLQGRGSAYAALLREGTTALLNSYNSIRYSYPTVSVISNMNLALMGSERQALMTALRFKRANSGGGGVRCSFTPCK